MTARPQDAEDFNPEAFLDEVQSGAPSDVYVSVPEDDGNGYVARIKQGSIKIEPVEFKRGERAGQIGKRFRAQWIVDDEGVRAATNLAEPTVRQEFLLDLTPAGAIAKGVNQNRQLGALIKALGLPEEGWSFRQMEGIAARIGVTHRADDRDANIKYAEVSRVTKA